MDSLAQIRPGDDTLCASRNRSVLATARDGWIHGQNGKGLFVSQVRLLSLYRYLINGHSPQPVGVSNLEEHNQIAYYVSELPESAEQELHGGSGERALELRLLRRVSDGFREEVTLSNHSQKSGQVRLELELDADFADMKETRKQRQQSGRKECTWHADTGTLSWTYAAEHHYEHQGDTGHASFRAGTIVEIESRGPAPSYDPAGKRLRFIIDLEPHGVWRCLIRVSPAPAAAGGALSNPETRYEEIQQRWLTGTAQFPPPQPDLLSVVHRTVDRARRDLFALRLFDLDQPDGGWTLSGGLPNYVAFFGRDALTASWQAALLGPEMTIGTLSEIAKTQATIQDFWRDEQPGMMIHQIDTGPLAQLKYNPFGRYYGTLTSPAFYTVALSNLWHWTGDRGLVRQFLDPALKALAWLDDVSKHDQRFYCYQSHSEQGLKNQSWKDSGDAIVYPDGRQVGTPIAPCEAQAYVFASKVRMSELLWWLEERDASQRFFEEAVALRDRFNEVFWNAEEHCFGMGLDPKGELIRSVGSESAHAIAAGIVHNDRVRPTVDRMFRADMFSGWGMRTLSSDHPAFNPLSYHRGPVWPAEQAAFSMGLMRYRLHDRLHQLAKAQFEAAAIFQFCRLPEVFSGHQRDDEHPIPAYYPGADWPQAWSASAVICIIQAMLGIFPYAPLNSLFLDPHLPEWLPEFRLSNLRVGKASVDLSFHRQEDGRTSYRIEDLRGNLHVVRQPSPWSLTAGTAERLVEALSSFLPSAAR